MYASAIKAILKVLIPRRLPVLLTGAPGLGKTSVVSQTTEEIDHDLIVSHPGISDTTDWKGFPHAVDGHAEFLPFGDIRKALEATRPTVWLLDDLGQAPPSVQAAAMPWLLARGINGHRLPDHVTVIAATNRRIDRAGVTGILEPVKSRFATILEMEADIDEWSTWAIGEQLSHYAIAWARFKGPQVFTFTPTADLVNCCMPRTLANAARILDLPLSTAHKGAAIAGAIGEGAATELMAFVKMADDMPSIDRILIDPHAVTIPQAPAVLYTLASALAARTTPANFTQVGAFLQRLVDGGRSEFAVLCLRDAMRRCGDKLTSTAAFVKLATSDLGTLLSGK